LGQLLLIFLINIYEKNIFRSSPVFNLLDRHILEDIFGVALFFVPLLVIHYVTAGFDP